jgi:hypothetical protein
LAKFTAELRLYPITVKGPGGEQLELQVCSFFPFCSLKGLRLIEVITCYYVNYLPYDDKFPELNL